MMFIQQILCLASVAPLVSSLQGHLHATYDEMVYDKGCCRIVRRRLPCADVPGGCADGSVCADKPHKGQDDKESEEEFDVSESCSDSCQAAKQFKYGDRVECKYLGLWRPATYRRESKTAGNHIVDDIMCTANKNYGGYAKLLTKCVRRIIVAPLCQDPTFPLSKGYSVRSYWRIPAECSKKNCGAWMSDAKIWDRNEKCPDCGAQMLWGDKTRRPSSGTITNVNHSDGKVTIQFAVNGKVRLEQENIPPEWITKIVSQGERCPTCKDAFQICKRSGNCYYDCDRDGDHWRSCKLADCPCTKTQAYVAKQAYFANLDKPAARHYSSWDSESGHFNEW